MVLLNSELSNMTPGGIAFVVVFFAVLAVLVVAGLKEQDKTYINMIKKLYAGKILEGNYDYFVTVDGELVVKYQVVSLGASVYKLDKVAYVMTTYVHTKRENYWEFGLYDIDKKLIKCNRIIPNKNKQSENALTVHTSQTGAEQMWQLVHKYVPHAKRVGRSFEDYAG